MHTGIGHPCSIQMHLKVVLVCNLVYCLDVVHRDDCPTTIAESVLHTDESGLGNVFCLGRDELGQLVQVELAVLVVGEKGSHDVAYAGNPSSFVVVDVAEVPHDDRVSFVSTVHHHSYQVRHSATRHVDCCFFLEYSTHFRF